MKVISSAGLPPILVLALAFVAGCSSTVASTDPGKYDKMSCAELNSALGDTATDISRTAISRGKVANTSVPSWLLGGETSRRWWLTATRRRSSGCSNSSKQLSPRGSKSVDPVN